MISSKRPDTKWMSNEWQEDRDRALADRSNFSDSELADLEITKASDGYGDNLDKAMHVDIAPIDPRTKRTRRGYDIRDKPEIGG